MKNNSFFLLTAIVVILSGCHKELISANESSVETATSYDVTNAIAFSAFSKPTYYGALIGVPGNASDPYAFVTGVASQLGLSCLRDKAPVPGIKKVKTLQSGYDILLNFTGTGNLPMNFRTDTESYKADLVKTLSVYTTFPKIAVIENEESNSGYYNGSSNDYLVQLQAAITVMHSYGIPVANGGLTSTGLAYLVYQDLLSQGLTSQANAYKANLKISLKSPATIDRANFINALLAGYAKMNLDYVNFHWRTKSPDDAVYLSETISYLKKVTGKTIITNEVGQYDEDPATLTATVQACKDANLPYIVWYSCEDTRSYPLQNNDETLTNPGFSYRDFINVN